MKRSPATAFWLSILPGLGHLYLGQVVKGFTLTFILIGIIDLVDRGAEMLGILIPVYWIFVMMDAYRTAEEMNRAEQAGVPPERFGYEGSGWWGWALIGMGAFFLLMNLGLIGSLEWLWRFWPVALIVIGIRLVRQKPPRRTAVGSPTVPSEQAAHQAPARPEAAAEGAGEHHGDEREQTAS